jgi:hypothetical protein
MPVKLPVSKERQKKIPPKQEPPLFVYELMWSPAGNSSKLGEEDIIQPRHELSCVGTPGTTEVCLQTLCRILHIPSEIPAGSVILNTETGAIEVCHTKPVSIVHLRSQP